MMKNLTRSPLPPSSTNLEENLLLVTLLDLDNDHSKNNKKSTLRHEKKKRKLHHFRIVGGRMSMRSRPWMAFLLILDDNRLTLTVLSLFVFMVPKLVFFS